MHARAARACAQGKIYSTRSDVYMFGMTVYETFAGCDPFKREQVADAMAVALCVRDGARPARLSVQECPTRVMDLIERCWAHDPSARPAMREVEVCLEEALRYELRI